MELEDILARLAGAKKAGSGYVAHCPAHDDKSPSLSINADDEGRILLHCHAGCETDAVVAAIGITMSDLFSKPGDQTGVGRSIGLPIETYDYRDESNALLYQVLRYLPKTFRQRRPDGGGGWHWNLRDTRRVVYRLPELKGRRTVLIPEGEKDVDKLWSIGLPATTNSGGAGKWTDAHAEQLSAVGIERVIIFPDNDTVGAAHAEQVMRSCLARGIAAKVVKLPELYEHGDVSDFLKVKSKHDLIALLHADKGAGQSDVPIRIAASSLVLTCLSDVRAEDIEWIWPSRIAKGKYTLIAGNPGEGKSRVAFDIAARISTGARWPDGGYAPLGNVLMLLAEDGLADTVRPALDAMGGDCSRVHVIEGIKEGEHTRPANLAKDLTALEEAIVLTTPVIVVIDPITAYLGGADSYKDAEVRGLLAPVLALIDRHGVALLAVAHLNKDQQKSALFRVGGSIAFTAAARCAFGLGTHPDDPDRRVLAQLKNNISRRAESLAFWHDGGRVMWDAAPVEITAEDLFSRRKGERSAKDEAEEFLRDTLADGPVESDALTKKAKAKGHSDATIRRAKNDLGVISRRVGGFGHNGKWFTALPNTEHLSALASLTGITTDRSTKDDHLSAFGEQADSFGNPSGDAKGAHLNRAGDDRNDDEEWEP